MADFSDIVNELKKTNSKLDELKQATGQVAEAADPSGAAAKEDANKKAAGEKKTQNLLKKMAGGITGLAKSWAASAKAKLKGLGGGLIKFLKATALAGLMVAALAFLQSQTWKDMKTYIVDTLVPELVHFWKTTLKPFVMGIIGFIKDPTWENFKKIFDVENPEGLVLGLAGLTALLAPGLLFKGLGLGIAAFTGAWKLAGKFLGDKGDDLKGTKGGPPGRQKPGKLRQIATKASKSIGDGLRSVWGKGVTLAQKAGTGLVSIATRASGAIHGALNSIWSTGKGAVAKGGAMAARAGGGALKAGKGLLRLMGGAARFAGPLGLAVTAGIGIIGGVTAGIEEYKKSGDLGKAVREGSAGALSALTFGLVSQETFSGAFIAIGDKFDSLTCSVTDAASKAWTAVKDTIPTKEQLTTAYNGLKDKVAGITTSVTDAASKAWTDVKDLIPTEAKLKEKFTTLKNDLAPLSEIKLPTEISFSAIKTSVGTMATALNASFLNITGIDIGDKLTGIKDSVASKATALACSFENITGINIDATLKSIGDGVTEKAGALVKSFENLTGIEIPSFAEIGEKVAGLLPDMKNPLQSLSNALRKSASDNGILDWWPLNRGARAISDVIDSLIAKRQAGGSIKGGLPYLVGEMGPELIIPSGSGQVFNAQRTEQILASGINRGMQGIGSSGSAIVNAPVNTVNNSQNNTTVTSTELTHPNSLLNAVNLAA